jgi:hypothetical protein
MIPEILRHPAVERTDPVWQPIDIKKAIVEEVSTDIIFPGNKGSRTPKFMCISQCPQPKSNALNSRDAL